MIDFLAFKPSTIAAAAVLCAGGDSFEISAANGQLFNERISKVCILYLKKKNKFFLGVYVTSNFLLGSFYKYLLFTKN